jgi:hypothetical protein
LRIEGFSPLRAKFIIAFSLQKIKRAARLRARRARVLRGICGFARFGGKKKPIAKAIGLLAPPMGIEPMILP